MYTSAVDYANVGVWYNSATHKWSIFNEDSSPMPLGAAFNVHAYWLAAEYDGLFVSTATAATISGDSTTISDPSIDNQPNTTLVVTPTWNCVSDNHPLGVFYHYETGHWAIFHEDGSPISPGAAYNIKADEPFWHYAYVHTTTSAETFWSLTQLDNPHLNGNPNALVFITQRWDEWYCYQTPYAPVCVLLPPAAIARNNPAVLVYYLTGIWRISNIPGVTMPRGVQFNVILW